VGRPVLLVQNLKGKKKKFKKSEDSWWLGWEELLEFDSDQIVSKVLTSKMKHGFLPTILYI